MNAKFPELQGLNAEQSKTALRYANKHSLRQPTFLITVIILIVVAIGAQSLLTQHLSPAISGAIIGAFAGLVLTVFRIPLIRKLIIKWRRENNL
ncbi:hypothetical protein SAMN02745181_3472 [Rubritalea squalenifaciens DSM 18772]|uniref:Uncharacterized protein n=2 Tax=Rubritalea TaxID=361050 RepID=A0A1M6QPZ9_9BACT|nr:hypothetical protein [Rubritalea squalenifaciens]SHK22359.1 hypothetical protein SAMN02745181_3472 [Rubritalea squalenifaciens DSM 18772]